MIQTQISNNIYSLVDFMKNRPQQSTEVKNIEVKFLSKQVH